jgi:hypothetical protein
MRSIADPMNRVTTNEFQEVIMRFAIFTLCCLWLSLDSAHASYGIYVGKNCTPDGSVFLDRRTPNLRRPNHDASPTSDPIVVDAGP